MNHVTFFWKLQVSFHVSFTKDSIVSIVYPSAAE